MATQILMPALSPTMTEGKLAKWLKNVGDEVHAGDIIAEIETDKATMEFEAVDEGKLAQILVDEGTEGVAVNTPIAVLAANGEDLRVNRPGAGASPAKSTASAQPAPPPVPQAVAETATEHHPAAAPASAPDKDWGPTQPITVREALRDAMAAEMRRDDRVFLIGEEVAQYQGAYKI